MANRRWRAAAARCPFYRSSTDASVTCTYDYRAGDVVLRFRHPRECAKHFGAFCAGNYTKCWIFGTLAQLGGNDDDHTSDR